MFMTRHHLPPGLSDPYLVVRYGQDTVFKTRVIKKTLDPEWNESATLSAPHSDDLIKVVWNMEQTFTNIFPT